MATGFLSVALLAFASNSISLTRNEKAADSTSAAAALVQEKLEQLRSMPVGAAGHNPGNYADATKLRADGTAAASGMFTRRWTVSAGNQPSNGLKTVTVEITWTDSRNHVTRAAAYVRCPNIPCV